MTKQRPIVHIDMDGTLVDFVGYFDSHPEQVPLNGKLDAHPEVFDQALPMPGAIEAIVELDRYFDLHILTKSPWDNPLAPSQKLAWIKRHFGDLESAGTAGAYIFHKRVTISHNKQLLRGDYLIDDRAEQYPGFGGRLIHIGAKTAEGEPCDCRGDHPLSWTEVVELLLADLAGA